VSRPGADADKVRRTVAVARWLQSVDYPAVRVVEAEQPVVIDGQAVTFWLAVSDDGDQFATVAEVADVLRRLHTLTAPPGLHLPELAPFANAARRIEANTWLTPEDRAFLTTMLAQMRAAYAGLEFTLRPGVIHGDASIGNVLRDSRGHPVVIDLDGFAVGPREWDVVLTAIYYDSFGWHTREEYQDFVRVYGYDIMTWPGYPVMRAVREFLMVTWVIPESPRIRAGRRRSSQAHRGPAHRREPQGLAALLSNSFVRPRCDPPQPGLTRLLVEVHGDSRIASPGQVLPEIPQVTYAPGRPDQLTRPQRHQRGGTPLLQIPRRQMGIGQHHRGEEVTADEPPILGRPHTATGVLGRIRGPPEITHAVPELGGQLRLIEVPDPRRVIFGPAPLELPHRLGQRSVASPSITQPRQRPRLHRVKMRRQGRRGEPGRAGPRRPRQAGRLPEPAGIGGLMAHRIQDARPEQPIPPAWARASAWMKYRCASALPGALS
jgi:aminoglycoside phosphotransferase